MPDVDPVVLADVEACVAEVRNATPKVYSRAIFSFDNISKSTIPWAYEAPEGTSAGVAAAVRPDRLGVRVSVTHRTGDYLASADVAIEYDWARRISTASPGLEEFIAVVAIRRATEAACSEMCAAAQLLNFSLASPEHAIGPALARHFRDRSPETEVVSET